MMEHSIRILGAGGHAKVLIATLLANGHGVEAVFDDDPSLHGTSILGVPVVGRIADLPADFNCPAAIGIGNNDTRRRIAVRFPQADWVCCVHPRAFVDPDAVIGRGSVVCAGAVVQPGTVIGQHVIVNTGATVDHDCRLDDFVHLGPGAHLAGHVHLDEGVFIGIGGSIIPCVRVGCWSTVGAGAAVVRDLPGRVTAVGVPARVVKIEGRRLKAEG